MLCSGRGADGDLHVGDRRQRQMCISASGTQTHPLIAGDGFLSQDAFTAHFGLGKRAEVTKATIHWPGGRTLDLKVPQKNRVHSIRAEAVE